MATMYAAANASSLLVAKPCLPTSTINCFSLPYHRLPRPSVSSFFNSIKCYPDSSSRFSSLRVRAEDKKHLGRRKHKDVSRKQFPHDFEFGVSTASYQVEGATRKDGRGESIWDVFTRIPGKIIDGRNGDIAVDQYNRYEEDVELMSQLGFGAYRFSVAWSRIFPDGSGEINEDGIAYYNKVINAVLDKGMKPYITLYHWDLPDHLESIGGWLSKDIATHFEIYAEALFERFGDRVKHWITLNEPFQTAMNGYDLGTSAPGRTEKGDTEPYIVTHNQLRAHAAAVYIYKTKFEAQGGQIGITLDCEWPKSYSDKPEDKAATQRRLDFQLGWYLDPIYFGDYPKTMRDQVKDRLPTFTYEDKKLLRNSLDFVGLNHYSTRLIAYAVKSPDDGHLNQDQQMKRLVNHPSGEPIGEECSPGSWIRIVPWGLRDLLNHVATKYGNPKIYVTENGMDDLEDPKVPLHKKLDDKNRVGYYNRYLAAVAEAISNGANVKGYFVWSFMDNFEWNQGYTKRFGIVYVDYKNRLARYPKSSALWFARFLEDDEGKTEDGSS